MRVNELIKVADVGKVINVYNGRKVSLLRIKEAMVNHYIGEFLLTRREGINMHILKKKKKGKIR